MKFKDVHPDVERYLAHDCYCPNEIYDPSGFFCVLFPADSECTVIAQNDKKTALLMTDKSEPHVVMLWHDNDDGDNPDGHILNAQRLDGTENNIDFAMKYVDDACVEGKDHIDSFDPESDRKSMEQLMSLCGGLVIRD